MNFRAQLKTEGRGGAGGAEEVHEKWDGPWQSLASTHIWEAYPSFSLLGPLGSPTLNQGPGFCVNDGRLELRPDGRQSLQSARGVLPAVGGPSAGADPTGM